MDRNEKEIAFSQAIKAGKRIYYVDVKRSRNDEMFLSITESKKVVSGELDTPIVNFEKHKIFLYREDFDKFMRGMERAINYIRENDPDEAAEEDAYPISPCGGEKDADGLGDEIRIDIDF
ncbi:MAG: PUR family DNA/RNA-binding protein [Mediterranea sp.]|nr:PUR family DNA/RNA-binding protein [Mediterranea sp.]